MDISSYRDELDYVRAKVRDANDSQSFLQTFCEACLRADPENYELLRPALAKLMKKYPARKAAAE